MRPTDPLTIMTIAGLLAAATLLARFVPAHPATGADPLIALRHKQILGDFGSRSTKISDGASDPAIDAEILAGEVDGRQKHC